MSTISVGEMLEEMQTGSIFSLEYVKLDRKRNTGGEIARFPQAMILQAEQKKIVTGSERKVIRARKAQHRKHFTRNIVICAEGSPTNIIRKIHPPLVLTFNGLTVTAKDARDADI